MGALPKILLVDDVDFFIELEKDFLRRTPAEILTAKNGQQALEIARREKPALIYMDVSMPVMDGLACCKALKKDPELKHIPVIMVFAQSKEIDNTDCTAVGCDGVLNKPVDRTAFLDIGRKYLFSIERREKRINCQVSAAFKIDGVDHRGVILDISSGGMYIQYRDPVPADAKIIISFYLPTVSAELIEVRGRITWVNQGFPRKDLSIPQGFGVQFMQVGPKALSVIRHYIDLHYPGASSSAAPNEVSPGGIK